MDFRRLDELFVFRAVLIAPRFISGNDFTEKKSPSISKQSNKSRAALTRVCFWSVVNKRDTNFAATLLICQSSVMVTELNRTLARSKISLILLFLYAYSLNIFIGSGRGTTARMLIVFKRHIALFEARIPLKNLSSFQGVLLTSYRKHIDCTCNAATE